MSFSIPLTDLLDSPVQDIEARARRAALVAHRSWVLGCPVDKGDARRSIQVSVGTLSTGEPTGAIARTEFGGQAFAMSAEKISRFELGQTIYIHSNSPYMQKLENGHSKQNRGFIKQAYLNAKLIIERG